jgi:hypothetical protein
VNYSARTFDVEGATFLSNQSNSTERSAHLQDINCSIAYYLSRPRSTPCAATEMMNSVMLAVEKKLTVETRTAVAVEALSLIITDKESVGSSVCLDHST